MPEETRKKSNDISLKQDYTPAIEDITPLAQRINCLDIERIAKVCVEDIPKLVHARFASFYVLDETNDILRLQQYNHPYLLNKIVSLNQNPLSPMIMAVKSNETILINNIDKHKKPVIKKSNRPFATNYKSKNCLIVPLVCQGKAVGVLNLADKMGKEGFDSEDVAVIELLSQLIGASIGNIRLFKKMQQQASKDGLTGLVNHRTFYEALEKELRRTRRYGGQISLIMVDVDNLKKINDTYGHRAGDKAICEISRRIRECIRQLDTPARYGGDEFAVILPNTSLDEAVVVAERMVQVVSDTPIVWKKDEISLSVSVGLGQYDSLSTPEDVTSCSDQALYLAKRAGKNMVKVFGVA